MKKLLILLVLASGCKKEDPKPAPPQCKTTTPAAEGRFLLISSDETDTIQVKFIRNNCPAEGENFYSFHNFYETVKPRMTDTTLFIKGDLEVKINETTKRGSSTNNPAPISFTIDLSGGQALIRVVSTKLTAATLYRP